MTGRRVLIVSPRFVPSNAPDMHRVRQALPHLREMGWEPTVLAVTPAEVEAPQDPLLARTIPDDVEVIRVGAAPVRWTRMVGVGSLEARSLPYLAAAGQRVLDRGDTDLVFFSTTAMGVTALGPRWHGRFDVPFAVDLQDPWYSRYYAATNVAPPGGRFKYSVANALAKRLEPYVLRRAAHIVTVSPAYPKALAARYAWFDPQDATVLPFGAAESDFELLRRDPVPNTVFDPDDGFEHWVYVGAAGPIMELSLRALFTALAAYRQREPEAAARLRLHFVGTAYAPAGTARPSVAPIARALGVGDLVAEQTDRVPYFEALQCLLDADALLMPGSDNPGYTASKLYPYILAKKPLLALFHEDSSVIGVLRDTSGGTVVPFAAGERPDQIAERITETWFEAAEWTADVKTDWEEFAPYTAREMTRRLAAVFDASTLPDKR